MTTEQLEQRVAALERTVADLQQRIGPGVPPGNWWEQVGKPFNGDPVFEEMLAYGRYFRKTGQMPPDDWKPGDPIPEPADDGP
jgi:hypothetical protein